MASPKKIMLLLPDGIGLRNFVYTGFNELAAQQGLEVTYWNNSPLDLSAQGFREIRFDAKPVHPLTNVLKYVKSRVELTASQRRTGDSAYENYYFPPPLRNLNDRIKAAMVALAVPLYNSEKGIAKLQQRINRLERKTAHYADARRVLEREKPDLLFCTNQRHLNTVAPIMAARDLGIPTAVFIFSWDNLPKATLFLESDYYLVWSDHMKAELTHYYPHIRPEQVLVTGTPQFDPHGQRKGLMDRETFLSQQRLDPDKRYICFSGDDVTTSPYDPVFLEDTALAVRKLNTSGHNLGIIFRRCPVDFSDRYDAIVNRFSDVIFPINPDWQKQGGSWGHIIPKANDLVLQINTIAHSEMVINVGSSMVFDFAIFGKPCAFVNYDVKPDPNWSVKKIYNFIHFRSMPSKQAVLWLDSPDAIAPAIQAVLSQQTTAVKHAGDWLAKITKQPAGQASQNILDAFRQILNSN